MMKINPKKTKIMMVFQKRARKNADFHFLIDSQIIDIVQEYTYTGTRMSSSGNFSVSREHLKEKALHALFSLRQHTNLSKLKASLACKIFDLQDITWPRGGIRILSSRTESISHE